MKGNKGITLIALVITIIVLLILAGVSIAMLTGDNSLLGNAQRTGPYNDIGAAKDEIGLAFNTAMQAYYENTYAGGTAVAFEKAVNDAISPFKAQGAETSNSKNNGCKVEYSGDDTTACTVTISKGSYKVTGTVDSTSKSLTWGEITKQ